jgi:CTP synthase
MQCAVIEFARNKCGMKNANSTEFDPGTNYPVIDFLPGQVNVKQKGASMRLGAFPCALKKGTLAFLAYKKTTVSERHRHRYEFNMKFKQDFISSGMELSGTSPDGNLLEIIELPEHPWFIACQFHPEFKSRFGKPHPLFREFIKHSLKQ